MCKASALLFQGFRGKQLGIQAQLYRLVAAAVGVEISDCLACSRRQVGQNVASP